MMAQLSTDVYDASGPFQLPFWAMYGEFGDLSVVAEQGYLASIMLLFYAFLAQILMVNLLIGDLA